MGHAGRRLGEEPRRVHALQTSLDGDGRQCRTGPIGGADRVTERGGAELVAARLKVLEGLALLDGGELDRQAFLEVAHDAALHGADRDPRSDRGAHGGLDRRAR